MSAIEQVFTISIVKDEHPRLYAEALAELAQLRADLDAAQRERDGRAFAMLSDVLLPF